MSEKNSGQDKYFAAARAQLEAIERTERPKIETAAQWMADALLANRFIYAFGAGHSHALAEEIFYRAGGLARVIPILDERLMVHRSATASTDWERKEGLAAEILSRYDMQSGDVLIVISNSGRNAVPIEMAVEAVRRGAKVAAISSVQYSQAFASRHSSGRKLTDIAHVVIDNHGIASDAAVELDGLKQRVGPLSTVSSAFILNAMIVEAAARVLAAGGTPEVWGSANSDATNNQALLAKYNGCIPHL